MTLVQTRQMPLLLDRKAQTRLDEYMPPDDVVRGLTEFFGALGDGTRLRIVSALAITRMCVSDLALTLGINQTTVSHQLRLLRTAGAVACRRQGKIVFYSLASPKLNEVMLATVNYLGY